MSALSSDYVLRELKGAIMERPSSVGNQKYRPMPHDPKPHNGWNPVKRLSHCYCHRLTPGAGHKPGWFERLLLLLVPHFDIIKAPDIREKAQKETRLYLRRFYIFRSKWFGWNFGDVYLHHIVESDSDPDPHDHPWGFRGLILAGGYTNDTYHWRDRYFSFPGIRTGPFPELVKPLTFINRPAEHIHKVILHPGKTAWTLLFTKGYEREWNFITTNGPVHWRIYLGVGAGIDVGE
jgi:hypothetical protein